MNSMCHQPMTKCVSPWYNCAGWLGVKHQFTYLLSPTKLQLKTWVCIFGDEFSLTWADFCCHCCVILEIKKVSHKKRWCAATNCLSEFASRIFQQEIPPLKKSHGFLQGKPVVTGLCHEYLCDLICFNYDVAMNCVLKKLGHGLMILCHRSFGKWSRWAQRQKTVAGTPFLHKNLQWRTSRISRQRLFSCSASTSGFCRRNGEWLWVLHCTQKSTWDFNRHSILIDLGGLL